MERYENGRCKQCVKENHAKQYDKDKDKIKKSQLAYRLAHKFEQKERFNNWLENNKTAFAENTKKWRRNNVFADLMVKKSLAQLKPAIELNLKYPDFTKELIDIKRLQMKLHHAIKQREKLEKVL